MVWFLAIISLNLVFSKLHRPEDILRSNNSVSLQTVVPHRNPHPDDSTNLYPGYTREGLVFYARMWQKGGINASSRKRDAEALKDQAEDAIYFLIATSDDRDKGYFIAVNPIGTIMDKMISGSQMTEWDANIQVKARKKDDYWEVLVFVPFKDLSYSKGPWGLQVMRVISKKQEIQLLYPAKELSPELTVNFSLDFDYIKPSLNFSLYGIPSIRFTKSDPENDWDVSEGITVRFKKGTSTLSDFTYRPDFSEIEADIKDITLSRLPVAYPEKRPFFVEGSSILSMPKDMIRTRNIMYPHYGWKFYSTGKNNSFGVWYVNDDTLGNIVYTRIKYIPMKNLVFGTFLNANDMGYNMFSEDFSYYNKKLHIHMDFQYSHMLNIDKNFYHIGFKREPFQGLKLRFIYRVIDSSFITPLNVRNLYFDNVKYTLIHTSYSRFARNNLYGYVYFYGKNIQDKSTDDLVKRDLAAGVVVARFPFVLRFSSVGGDYPYLKNYFGGLEDTEVKTYVFGVAYQVSAWKNLYITYTTGEYLTGNVYKTEIGGALTFRGMNAGLKYIKNRTDFDDEVLIQVYGEIPLILKHLVIKPYISFCDDKLAKAKSIETHTVIAYQPNAFSGIFVAIDRNYLDSGSGEYKKTYQKDVLKFQLGIYLNRFLESFLLSR